MTQESLIFHSKDFFGDAVDATLYFYRGNQFIYSTTFEDGYTAIKMPSELEPGVYDVVAKRDTGEYRINNLMISLASHYFSHSRLHNDIKLEGGNFDEDEIIEGWKFNPILHDYLSYLPGDAKQFFDDISRYSSNPDGMRWGGQITLNTSIDISRGSAFIDGDLIEWDDLSFDIPSNVGIYNIGIEDGQIIITEETVDYQMAILRKEYNDWIRMTLTAEYHPVYKGSNAYIFNDFEKESRDINLDMSTSEALFGQVYQGKSFGISRSTVPTKRIKVKKVKNGPVFSSDRHYVYATDDYFLLWEDSTLLTALPRWEGSHVALDWNEELVFISWGDNGHSRWSSPRPYAESYVEISYGVDPITIEEDLRKTILNFQEIAGYDFADWTSAYKSSTATISWTPYVLNPQLET